jgi:ABC transport system ATP-binding/permease protein
VTSTLVFEGEGKIGEYAGGYEDWKRQRLAAPPRELPKHASALRAAAAAVAEKTNNKNRRLSYKEQRELEGLPEKIEALEAEQSELHRLMGDGDFYRQLGDKITAAMERLEAVRDELEACYSRWQTLEIQAKGVSGNDE